MICDFVLLSKFFYESYPKDLYPEIAQKQSRPYIVILVEVKDKTFAVPLRSHIRHKHAFITDELRGCGLDFTKSVVISNPLFIDKSHRVLINKEESFKIYNNHDKIQTDFEQYLKDFIRAFIATKNENFKPTIVKYSSLIYFLKELGITAE